MARKTLIVFGAGVSISVEIALTADRPEVNRPGYAATPHEMGLEQHSIAFQPVSTGVASQPWDFIPGRSRPLEFPPKRIHHLFGRPVDRNRGL
jgi:hypothetical protein